MSKLNTDQSLEERFAIAKQRTDNDIAAAILVLASTIECHTQGMREAIEDNICPELAQMCDNLLQLKSDESES